MSTITTSRAYRVDTRVQLTKATHAGEEALILERIDQARAARCYDTAAAGSEVSGPNGAPYWYRVLVIRTGQELLVGHDWLAPLECTEYE